VSHLLYFQIGICGIFFIFLCVIVSHCVAVCYTSHKYHCRVSLVTKCVLKRPFSNRFKKVWGGRGGERSNSDSKAFGDYYVVSRWQKACILYRTLRLDQIINLDNLHINLMDDTHSSSARTFYILLLRPESQKPVVVKRTSILSCRWSHRQ
jgi:hypothetical protein